MVKVKNRSGSDTNPDRKNVRDPLLAVKCRSDPFFCAEQLVSYEGNTFFHLFSSISYSDPSPRLPASFHFSAVGLTTFTE